MHQRIPRILFWAPRILCILFAVFLSMFALDIFGNGLSFWQTVLGLLIHLIPVYIVVLVLVIAWRWEWVGAMGFAALAILYLVVSWGRFHWSAYAAISGPLVLIAILFLVNWILKARTQPQR
jgi:hypothetical protein